MWETELIKHVLLIISSEPYVTDLAFTDRYKWAPLSINRNGSRQGLDMWSNVAFLSTEILILLPSKKVNIYCLGQGSGYSIMRRPVTREQWLQMCVLVTYKAKWWVHTLSTGLFILRLQKIFTEFIEKLRRTL